MAQNPIRFELVRKGYDPQAVDQQFRQLNAEILRLSDANSDLQQQLKRTRQQLQESEAELAASSSPNFAALGLKSATIFAKVQQIAHELELDATTEAKALIDNAKNESEAMAQESEATYQSVVEDAKRRAAREIGSAKTEAGLILKKAQADSEKLRIEAEQEAARIRGMVATEVASLRTTAKRELSAKEAELEAKHKGQLNLALSKELTGSELLSEKEKAQLEAVLSERRAEAEAEYLAKHQEAVAATEAYLESAKKDLQELAQAAANLRLEIETLELEATVTQKRIIREARDQADGLIRAAEVEARNLVHQAREEAIQRTKAADANLTNLQNKVASIEIYLENLRSLVTDGFPTKDADGAEN